MSWTNKRVSTQGSSRFQGDAKSLAWHWPLEAYTRTPHQAAGGPTIVNVEVVVLAEYICRNHRRKFAAILSAVESVLDVYESFCIRIALHPPVDPFIDVK